MRNHLLNLPLPSITFALRLVRITMSFGHYCVISDEKMSFSFHS